MRRRFAMGAVAALLVLGTVSAQAQPPAQPAGSTPTYAVVREIPPRPTFATDMTPAERKVMQAHLAYWGAAASAGKVVIFGPVADPAGLWGMSVVRVANATEAKQLAENDPAVKGGIGMRYEILPMPEAIMGRVPATAP